MATYRAALNEARASFDRATERLRQITVETHQLNEEVSRLRRTITALSAMCSESPGIDTLGITDAVMEVMEDLNITMTTGDVIVALEGRGFDLAGQKNASASVHAILTRLASRGKITKVAQQHSNAVFWRGPNYKPRDNDTEFSSTGITDEDIPF